MVLRPVTGDDIGDMLGDGTGLGIGLEIGLWYGELYGLDPTGDTDPLPGEFITTQQEIFVTNSNSNILYQYFSDSMAEGPIVSQDGCQGEMLGLMDQHHMIQCNHQ